MMTHKQFTDYAKYLGATISTYRAREGQVTTATFPCKGNMVISFRVMFNKGSSELFSKAFFQMGWNSISLNELEDLDAALHKAKQLQHYVENFKS
jgi:hypothetical protein